jgi:hypothetical protein
VVRVLDGVYTLTPTGASIPAAGGSGFAVTVTFPNSCVGTGSFTAVSNDGWIHLTNGSNQGGGVRQYFLSNGSATVTYDVEANPSSNPDVGTITIAGRTFTVNQSGNTSFVPVAGVWWSKTESGSGLGLDYQNGTLIVEVYSYLAGGPSQWYLAAGPLNNNVFTAPLDKYVNGQCVSCAYKAPGASGNDGTITITFTSPTTATADLPGGRDIEIERFFKSAPVAGPFIPVPGVWWNKNESGSGLGLDYENGTLIAEVYSYLAGGASQWYLAAGPVVNNVFSATLDEYTGGQCIFCAYKAPVLSGNDGTITITFTLSTTVTVDLPGGRHIQIERFFQP